MIAEVTTLHDELSRIEAYKFFVQLTLFIVRISVNVLFAILILLCKACLDGIRLRILTTGLELGYASIGVGLI